MTRLSVKQARELGIDTGPAAKSRATRRTRSQQATRATWDAHAEVGSSYTIWICIPNLPPSLNEWSRKHWETRHKKVAELTEALQGLKMAKRLLCIGRAEVQLIYYFRDERNRDPDNYAGKFILDGLRHAGIIAEDNSKVLRLPQPEFRVDRLAPRTEVFITGW